MIRNGDDMYLRVYLTLFTSAYFNRRLAFRTGEDVTEETVVLCIAALFWYLSCQTKTAVGFSWSYLGICLDVLKEPQPCSLIHLIVGPNRLRFAKFLGLYKPTSNPIFK